MEIETKGILGLRVQDVARKANVSVPLIYKYFGDRDGLLVEVLSEMFEDCRVRHNGPAMEIIAAHTGPVTVDLLMKLMVMPDNDQAAKDRAMTAQMLAAAAEIPALRARLAGTSGELHSSTTMFLTQSFKMLGMGDSVPTSALAMLFQSVNFGLLFNDLLDGNGASHDELVGLLRVMLESVVERHSISHS